MSFAFDMGSPVDNLNAATGITDAIHDSLPVAHTESEFHYALAAHVKGRIASYKNVTWLIRFWASQQGPILKLAEADPILFSDLVNHLAERLEELT